MTTGTASAVTCTSSSSVKPFACAARKALIEFSGCDGDHVSARRLERAAAVGVNLDGRAVLIV